MYYLRIAQEKRWHQAVRHGSTCQENKFLGPPAKALGTRRPSTRCLLFAQHGVVDHAQQLTGNTTLFLRLFVEEDIQAGMSRLVKAIRQSCWAFSCVQIIIPSLLPAQCQRGPDDG